MYGSFLLKQLRQHRQDQHGRDAGKAVHKVAWAGEPRTLVFRKEVVAAMRGKICLWRKLYCGGQTGGGTAAAAAAMWLHGGVGAKAAVLCCALLRQEGQESFTRLFTLSFIF